MKLLIVDDNPIIRKTIHYLLSECFSEFFECENGLEAFNLYSKHRPDWVVMDIEMPGVDGLIGTQLIKRSFPAARIIAVSNNEEKEIVQLAKSFGAKDYVFKSNLSELKELFC